ncbi:MAG: hypothetical protein DRP89_02065 [Candidatus Neomarinimicrobiota bacterium]|nr:MAG: hypothetical protein DRP89_02065 [Candidatus Neomarinimicrobiota bacterium]
MKNSNQKKRKSFFNYKMLIGLLISILGLYLGFRKFDSKAFISSLQSSNLILFFLAMLIMVFTVFLRAWRWKYLVLPLKKIPLNDLFAAEMICYFGNNVFPLRMGELLRSYSLSKMSGISVVSIFGTVVMERILDSLVFAVILILAVIFLPEMPVWIKWGGVVASIIIVIVGLLLYILSSKKEFLKSYLKNHFKIFSMEKVVNPLSQFIRGLSALRSTPHLGLISIQSSIIWILCIFVTWVIGASFNIYFSIGNLLLIFFVTSAIISIPSSPGYVGTYHAGVIGILLFIGLDLSLSQAIAVVLHAVGFLSLTLIGFVYFIKYHVSIKETSRRFEIEKGQIKV